MDGCENLVKTFTLGVMFVLYYSVLLLFCHLGGVWRLTELVPASQVCLLH
jgi:hypothetical protein